MITPDAPRNWLLSRVTCSGRIYPIMTWGIDNNADVRLVCPKAGVPKMWVPKKKKNNYGKKWRTPRRLRVLEIFFYFWLLIFLLNFHTALTQS